MIRTGYQPIQEIPKIKIVKKELGEICFETLKNIKRSNEHLILLKNSENKILGKELLFLENDNPNASGLYIETSPEYRRKGFGIGEILRLSSIILILKNKIQNFEIYSKPEAIYFHNKYKFSPAIKNFTERDNVLKTVIKNCTEKMSEFKTEAENLLNKSINDKTPEVQRNLCIQTNELLKKYFDTIALKKDEYKSHPFDYGIRMILHSEDILKNSDFFNNLFKKHKIDYQI